MAIRAVVAPDGFLGLEVDQHVGISQPALDSALKLVAHLVRALERGSTAELHV
jgi:hypothetical protein